ncbi:MAG: nucleotidyltransferase family protein [Pseudomonadota bacterium]
MPEPNAGPVWGVLLAAGGSRRLGRPKQKLRIQQSTVLEHAVAQAQAVFGHRLICVLGARAPQMPALPCHTLVNTDWQAGMASSIAVGLRATPRDCSVAMLLCDQPRVGAEQLSRLLERFHHAPHQPAAARYADRLGVPAIFPAGFRDGLLALEGDRGAGKLLNGGDPVTAVDMPEAACDIDTKDDAARLTDG